MQIKRARTVEYRRDLGREIRSQDYMLLVIVTAIVAIGLLSIGNATADALPDTAGLPQRLLAVWAARYVRLQALWFGLGLVIMALVTFLVDYDFYGRVYLVIYALNILILIMLLIFASSTRGAVSWFEIGERALQPSEFCKIAIILCLARALSQGEGRITRVGQLIWPVAMFAAPFILIILQPDLGTALVYIAIFVGMLFVAGVNLKIMLTGAGLAAVAVPLAIKYVLNDDQRMRLNGFFGMTSSASTSDSVYQLKHSMLAIGNGGLWGRGLLTQGSISQLDYVPDQYTDFVFSSTAEAFGYIGAAIVVALYLLLLLRLFYMAVKTPDRFGRLIIVGVASMFFFHIFENIGMTFGLMPITGIPLPLMSYGGSSMWTNMIALGLAQNAYCRRNRVRYTNKRAIAL